MNPYLNFNGNARQALEFYRDVFGGELTLSTFGELDAAEGADADADADADKIMHAQLQTGTGYTLMGADVPGHMQYEPPAGFAISLSGDDNTLHGYFDKLSSGGDITVPLAKQAWGDEFGMCTDKFGVQWMVNIGQPQQAN
ncbi:MAG TPA: VOC family protein [Streptosporangiaceae bacterium]|nr:VOC family protein [Streptosporangiaceae bacterium]